MNYHSFAPWLLGSLLLFPASSSQAASDVPNRSEVPQEAKWQLEHIYPSNSAWESALVDLNQHIETLQSYKGRLHLSPEIVFECLQIRSQLNQDLGKVYGYARMHLDTDQTSSDYQVMQGKAQNALTEASTATSFIEPELLALPSGHLEELIRLPQLKDYHVYLTNLIRQKPHTLSTKEEELLAATLSIASAPQNIFGAFSYGDMKFPPAQNQDGDTFPLSESRFSTLLRSSDRSVRESAFDTLLGTYHEYRTTYAALLNASIQKDHFYSKVRKYPTDLAASLKPHAIPLSVYHNLIDTVNEELPLLHRYMEIRKKVLGVKELHLYDLYVPIIADPFPPLSYEEGVRILQEGLKPLGDQYLSDMNAGITGGWIDRYENQGKKSGAYSWGIYGVHPFVLLNYQNKLDDVLTLAHELGHSMHSYYSQKHQPYSTSGYTIFSAEIASTTNEALVLQHLLKNAQTKEERIFILNQMAESIRTTLYRQTLFAEFEFYIHDEVQNNGSITADGMETKWVELYQKYYGPNIVIDDAVKSEWSRIPHFYRDFYVYQYATGISAAWAFKDQIQNGGEEGRNAYLQFLQSGSSKDSIDILKEAGLDMSTPLPIQSTLKQFEWVLDELERELEKES